MVELIFIIISIFSTLVVAINTREKQHQTNTETYRTVQWILVPWNFVTIYFLMGLPYTIGAIILFLINQFIFYETYINDTITKATWARNTFLANTTILTGTFITIALDAFLNHH